MSQSDEKSETNFNNPKKWGILATSLSFQFFYGLDRNTIGMYSLLLFVLGT